jgi:hypothetical protein
MVTGRTTGARTVSRRTACRLSGDTRSEQRRSAATGRGSRVSACPTCARGRCRCRSRSTPVSARVGVGSWSRRGMKRRANVSSSGASRTRSWRAEAAVGVPEAAQGGDDGRRRSNRAPHTLRARGAQPLVRLGASSLQRVHTRRSVITNYPVSRSSHRSGLRVCCITRKVVRQPMPSRPPAAAPGGRAPDAPETERRALPRHYLTPERLRRRL